MRSFHCILRAITLVAAAVCSTQIAVAAAQAYPQRPVRVIVPSATGAATDVVARLLAQKLTAQFGKPFIVDNRPGAGNVIGTDLVAKALPDGHTIGLVYTPHTVNASLQAKLPFDPIGDFAAVTMLTSAPLVLAVTASLPVHSFRDLVALAKTRPLAYGSAGIGSGGHMSGELMRMMTGLSLTHVPHKGAAPASIDVAAGNLAFQFASQITLQPLLTSNRLRAIAVTSARRAASLPDVATVVESGYPDFVVLNWLGVLAPAKTPRATIDLLHASIGKILQMHDVRERLTGEGSEIVGSTPEEFTRFLKDDLVKWAKVVKAAGIRLD
jgi:tripartite-type tricarboxylate transporter receptor subunit TctC